MKRLVFLLTFCLVTAVTLFYGISHTLGIAAPMNKSKTIKTTQPQGVKGIKMLKDVGEAYMDHFGLHDNDFIAMQKAGINVIEGNFDICASDNDVEYFLDQSQKNHIKVVMNAGSGEAEWGYDCDEEPYPIMQQPVWQSGKVIAWVKKWKNHPAIYAWDISNEAGSVFPNASWRNDQNTPIPSAFYLNAKQLQTAYHDVKTTDPTHPVMIRMNGWFFYDDDHDFFKSGNPFAKNVADIVMINAYSNVEDYYGDFVSTVMSRAISSTQAIDPHVTYIASLGVWKEIPLWYLPTEKQFGHDVAAIKSLPTPVGLSFFKYGAKGSEWYLPTNAPTLWKAISNLH